MKILALEHELPAATTEQFRLHLKDEARRAWGLYQSGVIRELYFRSDQHAAVLILECGTLDEAHQALNSLPLVQQGLIEFEVIPLEPYPGFARLFAD